LILTLFTNGTLLTRQIADYLAEWRPFKIEITLYGATQETYERVTGIPGSYTRCRRGIDLLLERKLPLGLKTMVMTINHHELEQMKALAGSLGVQFRFDPILHPALNGSTRPTNFRLTPEEIVAIEMADPDRAKRWPEKYRDKPEIPSSERRMYQCGAGRQGFHIDATGKMSPCLIARRSSYDLRKGSFKECWEQFIPEMINCVYSESFECLGCRLRHLCAQCPAVAELEHDDVEKRVEFLCQVAKMRRDVFA
jgi:radical SAM protein with 4Fe4S-binding SPASM domain